MISTRFVRAVSLLTIILFLLSASVNETLHRMEISPRQSELVVYGPSGRPLAVYRGDLRQLQAASMASAPRGSLLHRLRESVRYQWL